MYVTTVYHPIALFMGCEVVEWLVVFTLARFMKKVCVSLNKKKFDSLKPTAYYVKCTSVNAAGIFLVRFDSRIY